MLRVLQEKKIRRIGSDYIIPVDVRVIAATNRNLAKMIKEEKFRMDLYYRINAFTIIVPPLRERKSDIMLIVKSLFDELGYINKGMDDELKNVLYNHKWEGNVRELNNCVEYMCHMSGGKLCLDDLPPYFISEEFNNKVTNIFSIDGFTIEESDVLIFILKILKRRNAGRAILHKLCSENGYMISEYKLRGLLKYLNKNGYIKYGEGRKGAIISDKGILLVEDIHFPSS